MEASNSKVALVALVSLISILNIAGGSETCEPISIPLCKGSDLGYNMTKFPNSLHHQKQDDAGLEIHQFYPLVKVECAKELKLFLCSVYAPICSQLREPILPCRELCQQARDGCQPLMNRFGFEWPSSLSCDSYPKSGEKDLCVAYGDQGQVSTIKPEVEEVTSTPKVTSPPDVHGEDEVPGKVGGKVNVTGEIHLHNCHCTCDP